MMLLIWPMIFALILGLIIGSQIKLKNGDTHFTLGSFIVILIIFICINRNFCRQTNICKE